MKQEDYIKENMKIFDLYKERPLHSEQKFINKDGIVDIKTWNNIKGKKIMFLLKEAYHSDDSKYYESGYDLADDLKNNGPWNGIWKNVANWVYAIENTTKEKLADYATLYNLSGKNSSEIENEMLRKVAVVNIKKSSGKKDSDPANLQRYVDEDKDLLLMQIKLINPDVIVCGSTMGYLDQVLGGCIQKKELYSPNWFYNRDIKEVDKKVIILDPSPIAASGDT